MFQQLGEFVTRRSAVVLGVWLLLVIAADGVWRGWLNELNVLPWHVPTWNEVKIDGEAAFLPKVMPSIQAEMLFEKAFPDDLLNSSVVIVVEHESAEIDDDDKAFIKEQLVPRLTTLKEQADNQKDHPGSKITKIRTLDDPLVGMLLLSKDKKASLVIVELSTEFLDHSNRGTIDAIERLTNPKGELQGKIPPGVTLWLSGSATVGRDMINAAIESASATERWTIGLVIVLLLLIYRAPFLALIPLFTVFVAMHISLALIVLLGSVPGLGFQPFEGLKTYITVVAYGAGVDYCLFLVARYKEELDRGCDMSAALAATLEKIGPALTASAGTVACGIGMMVFAQFGKFQQAGKGMALSLVLMLIASLTFTPALLEIAGKWAFWPRGRRSRAGWLSTTNVFDRVLDRIHMYDIWERIGRALLQTPGRIWLACVLCMLPFAFIGVYYHGYLSYGLLSELPKVKQSVVGAAAVQRHFSAGSAGPLTILLENEKVNFQSPEGRLAVKELTEYLDSEREKLGIADIRSVSQPRGLQHKALPSRKAMDYYVSQVDEFKGTVARIDVVFEADPFSRDSVLQLETVRREVERLLSKSPAGSSPTNTLQAAEDADKAPSRINYIAGSNLHLVGTTPFIRDLKQVTDHDEIVIDTLVLLVVYAILVLLLRKPAISAYLILSVFFSYFVALGVTFAVFWALDPGSFAGLDWKVPIFLFTILIAVGEDYNIFLMTRIEEEQRDHGPVEGVYQAQLKTGGIISSCGIIMAGTFLSLVLAGSLVGMQQLGFALSFGVLLDTFVVRPVLVPAYLIMLHSGRFGALGKFLGGTERVPMVRRPEPVKSEYL